MPLLVKLFQDALEIDAFYLVLVSLYGDGTLALLHEYVVVAADSPKFPASFLCVVTNFFKLHCLNYNIFVYLSIYLFTKIENAAPFSPLFHQYLYIEQLFPICFGAFFAGNAPEVFPDFVVEGIDFGGLGVGDGAIGGAVHFVLLSAYKLYKRRCF